MNNDKQKKQNSGTGRFSGGKRPRDDRNTNNGPYSRSSPGSGDVPEEKPVYKGEVYFSNPPRQNNPDFRSNTGKKRKKKGFFAANIALFSVLIVIFTSALVLSAVAVSCINDVLAIGRKSDVVTVKIPEGSDTDDILKILKKNGLIKQRLFCKLFVDASARIKKSRKPEYLNGVYYIRADMGVEAMLDEFKSVQKTAQTVRLVFPEGWTIYQMFDKLDEYNVCRMDYLTAALEETKFSYSFLSSLNDENSRTLKLEGYFFPDTYEFYENENANSAIRRFLTNFNEKWTDQYADRAKQLGLTVDEIIIIASIIQREAANDKQMAAVSSVIHNRLNNTHAYPALECDSTSDYITNFIKPVLGEEVASSFSGSYNTYTFREGLPPGPICNPGIKAIEAALYPEDTDYFYFQHDKSGKIYMAKTLDEHNRNSIEVLKVNNN